MKYIKKMIKYIMINPLEGIQAFCLICGGICMIILIITLISFYRADLNLENDLQQINLEKQIMLNKCYDNEKKNTKD